MTIVLDALVKEVVGRSRDGGSIPLIITSSDVTAEGEREDEGVGTIFVGESTTTVLRRGGGMGLLTSPSSSFRAPASNLAESLLTTESLTSDGDFGVLIATGDGWTGDDAGETNCDGGVFFAVTITTGFFSITDPEEDTATIEMEGDVDGNGDDEEDEEDEEAVKGFEMTEEDAEKIFERDSMRGGWS